MRRTAAEDDGRMKAKVFTLETTEVVSLSAEPEATASETISVGPAPVSSTAIRSEKI
jgi:hypothetical protein